MPAFRAGRSLPINPLFQHLARGVKTTLPGVATTVFPLQNHSLPPMAWGAPWFMRRQKSTFPCGFDRLRLASLLQVVAGETRVDSNR